MSAEFSRINRLPQYVFNITGELKMAARRRGEDIIDLSMGNPDGPTPPHIVEKLVEAARRPANHGYSISKGIPRLRKAISNWYQDRYSVDIDPESEAIVTIGCRQHNLPTSRKHAVLLRHALSRRIRCYGPRSRTDH